MKPATGRLILGVAFGLWGLAALGTAYPAWIFFFAGPSVPTWTFFGLGSALIAVIVALAVTGGKPAWLGEAAERVADHVALVLGMIFLGVALLSEKDGLLSGLGAALFLGGFLYVLLVPVFAWAWSAGSPESAGGPVPEEPDTDA